MREILVIDDNRINAKLIEELAAVSGRPCRVYSGQFTPDEIAVAVKAGDWAAVLLDINLGQASGLDIIRKLEGQGVNLAVVSGMEDADLQADAQKLGVKHFFTKPLDINVFVEFLSSLPG